MIRLALLLFAFFGLSGLLSARTVRSGTPQVYRSYRPARTTIAVEDKETKDPLIGATVSIISRADTLRGTTAKEDFYRTLAVYKCDRIFRDSVDLEVTYIGYKPYKKRFAATEFRSRIEVKMEVDEQSIAQVVVVGKQIAMVFKGDTTVYNAGAFKTLADDRFEELLKQLPGVEIKDNKILAGGEEVKRVLIDGKNFFGNKSQYALTDLEASDVKSVRVYEELSPEAKRQGNTTARKEKVMDVETKSKRSVLQGGNLEGSIGASLEKDYSGRREIRHSEAGTYYRNSEKGNWRIEASNQKDDNSQAENASFNSKLTPTKQTDARAEYTYRRGDSTLVSTTVDFQRRRQSSVSRSMTEYFPTDDYALRTEESSGESLSKNLSGSLSNLTSIQRKKNTFFAMTDIRFDSGDSYSRSATSRRIDNDETRTHLNNDSDNRNLSFNIRLNYYISLSKRSSLSFWIIGDYGTQDQNGWQIDTTASVQGLQVKLRNNGDGRRYGFETSVDYGYKVGENVRFSTSYSFKRGYDRSKMLAIDFLGDPQGELDLVNSYSYTNDSYSHNLRANLNYGRDGLWIMGALTGSVHRIARDERFPERQRFPRTFYQLSPWFNLTAGSSFRRFNLNIISQSQMISTESLRSTLDATNPPLAAGRKSRPETAERHNGIGRDHLQQRPESPQRMVQFQRRVHLQLHRFAAHLVPRRDLPSPIRLYGPEGCAALDADQRRRVLQTRRNVRVFAADLLAAFDGERRYRLQFPADPLFPRRDALPLGPPCALVPRRLRIGLLEQSQDLRLLRDLDELLLRPEQQHAGPAGDGPRPVRPALREIFRLRGERLRILLQQQFEGADTPQRDPQRRGGPQVRQGEPAGNFAGRRRHPQPPGLRLHGVRNRLYANLFGLLPGPLRLPAHGLHVLNETEPKYEFVSDYFVIFRILGA